MQWNICLLHCNELPLRHLIQVVDGKTSGPNTLTGPIGKVLPTCEQLPVINFRKINAELIDIPPAIYKDLSNDQKYLFRIVNAIIAGECGEDLKAASPGKLCHARWLTMANRILRTYISTENPSSNLKLLVKFFLKVYVP